MGTKVGALVFAALMLAHGLAVAASASAHNPQEAAEFLRVPLLTVQPQAKADRLPGRRIGREWRFSRTVLIDWLAAGPDHHDLELYNRKSGGDEEAGGDAADTAPPESK